MVSTGISSIGLASDLVKCQGSLAFISTQHFLARCSPFARTNFQIPTSRKAARNFRRSDQHNQLANGGFGDRRGTCAGAACDNYSKIYLMGRALQGKDFHTTLRLLVAFAQAPALIPKAVPWLPTLRTLVLVRLYQSLCGSPLGTLNQPDKYKAASQSSHRSSPQAAAAATAVERHLVVLDGLQGFRSYAT